MASLGCTTQRRSRKRARRLLAAALLTAVAKSASVGDAITAARADWPFVRGDAQATGTVATDSLAGELHEAWTFRAEESGFEATAAIVDGVVYVGDVDGTFYALRLADGGEVWRKKFDETGFLRGSAVVDGAIYTVDYNGVLWKLSAQDGAEVWKYETNTSLYAAPNVHGGLVLLATEAGDLLALDQASGELTWKFTIDQPLRCWPVVVAGRALVAGCDRRLYRIDAATGAKVDDVEIAGPADSMPAVQDDRVFFCTAGGVFHAMNLDPLAEAWKYGHRGQNQEIHAAAVAPGRVVFAAHDKRLVALHPETGEELWQLRLRAPVESSPVIVGSRAFLATLRGRLQAVDLADGKESWHEDLGGRFLASPAVADGRLVIGADDGVLYCFMGEKPQETATKR